MKSLKVDMLGSKMLEIVGNFYEFYTSYIQMVCFNFNKFDQFSKDLWPKTHHDKNQK